MINPSGTKPLRPPDAEQQHSDRTRLLHHALGHYLRVQDGAGHRLDEIYAYARRRAAHPPKGRAQRPL